MKKLLLALLLLTLFIPATAQDNNMQPKKLVLLPVKNDPTVSVKIMFYAGSQDDPKGKEGLAYLTAMMLSQGGTKNNSYESILEKLYPLAASYEADPAVETTTFTGRVHKDNLNEYYSLFMDAVLHPAFNEDDFGRLKDDLLNYLTTSLKYSSDEELGKAVLYNKVYEGTPYGHISEGTISGINSITIKDVEDFYHKYYSRNNFTLGLGGSYSSEFEKKIQDDLNTLPGVKVERVQKPDVKPESGVNVTIVEKNAPATAFSLGFPISITRGNREWYALAIVSSWMGEHRNSSSHLYNVIREKRGLNYGDYSYIENFPNGGSLSMPPVNYPRRQQMFEIWLRPVPNETRHFALRAALRELQKLVDNGMTKEQFDLTSNFLYKYVLHYAPSTEERLGYAVDDVFYGVNGSHLELFRKMMKEITLDEVNAAIKKYLQYKNMDIAVITKDGEAFKDALVKNESSPITYTSPKAQEILEEDKIIQAYPLNIKEENVRIVPVEDLFK